MNELLKIYLKNEIKRLHSRLEKEANRNIGSGFIEGYKEGIISEINTQIQNLEFILRTDWDI